jgi:hypothetical protein
MKRIAWSVVGTLRPLVASVQQPIDDLSDSQNAATTMGGRVFA